MSTPASMIVQEADWAPRRGHSGVTVRLKMAAVAALLLCLGDGALTVLLGDYGITEANPLMAALLEADGVLFLLVKCVVTGAGLAFFVRYARYQFYGLLRGERIVYLVLVGYGVVVAYELAALSAAVTLA